MIYPGSFLCFYQGSLYLTIGYHQLEGKAQTLKKPLAVLSKNDSIDPLTGQPSQEYKVNRYVVNID